MGLNNIKAKFQYILNIRGVETDVLAQAPKDWLNTTITYKRNSVYNGLFKALSLPLGFVTKGAYLLRKEFYKNGVLSRVKVAINKLVPSTLEYANAYNGRLDFSKSTDEIGSYTVNSISDDFSVQLAANESTDYAIPVDVDEAIMIELPPLPLNEQAVMSMNVFIDLTQIGFPGISVVNNEIHSVVPSVHNVQLQTNATPDFSTSDKFFYRATADTLLSINVQGLIGAFFNIGGTHNYKWQFIKQDGTVLGNIYDQDTPGGSAIFNISGVYNYQLLKGDSVFLFLRGNAYGNQSYAVSGGIITLTYKTQSPATMCKALPFSYVAEQLLQAMNTNDDSGPNQPVPFKSDLLNGPLKPIHITCSDSIRLAEGSLYKAGDPLSFGGYKVVSGNIVYNGITYNLNDQFSYVGATQYFTGTGIVERINGGFIGNVYNPGDTLQAGGTYLVGGDSIVYNGITYAVGAFFKFVLGQETFTGVSDLSFVEQTSVSPQLILNFKSFFQSVYSLQGGNCAFGIEKLSDGTNRCFIEDCSYVYRGTIGNLDAGIVDKTVKIEPATDILINTILVGYKDQQYASLNGYLEVNSNQTYGTAIVTPQKQLNLMSEGRADPYGIEEIRASQNDTAASRSDNNWFFIWTYGTPVGTVPFTYYKPLQTEELMTNPTTGKPMISGVGVEYYNWRISPKQNLIRGGGWLRSLFYNMAGYSITLASAPKNTAMVTTDLSGRRVAESEPLKISDLPTPLFLPFYCTFKPGLPLNAMEMIDSIPYGYIKFQFYGKPYKMFAQSISVDIGHNTQQEFKGLMLPNSDLTQLIR